MTIWIFAFFVFAHGVAHMVYTSLAMGWIPAADVNSTWSGASWLLTGALGLPATRSLGASVFTLVTLAFAVAAVSITLRQPWASTWLAGTAIASILALFLFWDGSLQDLVSKGAIGLAINKAILIALYVFRFPAA
ncbi:MAG: hypothetical protein WD751_05990 [Anaerolineales bacterium]